jgi:signal transduction histidine kinase
VRSGRPEAARPLLAAAERGSSALLLFAALERRAPAWAAEVLESLGRGEALAVLGRLREHAQALEVGPLLMAIESVAERRALLGRVAAALDTFAHARSPVTLLAGDELLLFFPPDRGALAKRADLEALWPGRELALGARASEAAEPVVAAALWMEPDASGALRWSGTAAFGALALVLGTTLALVLVLALRAVREQAAFLATVTHELKTPLAGIRMFAEILEQGRVDGANQRAEYHRLLAGEAARLSSLIENVLDLGRLERGERAYDQRPLEPHAVVREALELASPLLARDGLELEAVVAKALAPAIADRGAFVQALHNVLDNARKYARAGARVAVTAGPERDAYVVRVRDFGPGVAARERDRVFARFVRGEAQRDGSVPGLGIGLHLARTLLRAQGGELRYEEPADAGGGACFVLSLPLAEAS